jgi:hypothetical protein
MPTGDVCVDSIIAPAPLEILDYLDAGLRVFPVHGYVDGHCGCGDQNCTDPGKKPHTKNGFKDATDNLGAIRAWWKRWPNANVGIATGVYEGQSEGIIVVDVDPKHDGQYTWADLCAEHGPPPETFTVQTGSGGWHYYYRVNVHISSGNNALGNGIDIKAQGGYAVAPPSNHKSSGRYTVLRGSPFEIAPCPDWLLERLRHRETKGKPPLSEIPERIPEHERNSTLTRYAGLFRSIGFTPEEIYEHTQMINLRRSDPPLDPHEVKKLSDGMQRYDRGTLRPSAPEDCSPEVDPQVRIAALEKDRDWFKDEYEQLAWQCRIENHIRANRRLGTIGERETNIRIVRIVQSVTSLEPGKGGVGPDGWVNIFIGLDCKEIPEHATETNVKNEDSLVGQLGISRRSIGDYIDRAEKRGFLERDYDRHGGKNHLRIRLIDSIETTLNNLATYGLDG